MAATTTLVRDIPASFAERMDRLAKLGLSKQEFIRRAIAVYFESDDVKALEEIARRNDDAEAAPARKNWPDRI